ncbi:hypothetical protein WDU94_005536, partial [Cyamophila willieti]
MLCSSVCWIFVWLVTVNCYPNSELFKNYMKSRNLESLYNIVTNASPPPTTTHPTSYAIVEEKSDESTTPVDKTEGGIEDEIVTESLIQQCFNELAANNFPRILKAMN